MLNNKTIAVVVPAFNEEKQISLVIRSMPSFVDRIVIVNDFSTDATTDIVKEFIEKDVKLEIVNDKPEKLPINALYGRAELILEKMKIEENKYYIPALIENKEPDKDRIVLITHTKNAGVGAAIASGYKWCRDNSIDCTAVMAGDGQMDPSELESICMPVINDGIDYVKGNRLIHRSALLVIPKIRYFGNSVLSILTKIASGYWHISDTQTGYTAISNKALNAIRLYKIYKGYGMPNDLLVKLNIAFCTIKEVEIKPVYDIGEKSKMRLFKVIPKISFLLLRSFFGRLWIKYFFRDFHPLFLLYNFSFLLGIIWLPYFFKVIKAILIGAKVSFEPLFAFTFLGITAFQMLLFAMWMDIQDNDRLYK